MTFKLNVNMSKKDIINAQTSSMKIVVNDQPLIVTGIAVVQDGGTNQDGTTCDVGYIATDEGVFGFISNVMMKHIDLLADYLKDCLDAGEVCKIVFTTGKTDNGDFYSFKIVD